jgi:ribonuclease HI
MKRSPIFPVPCSAPLFSEAQAPALAAPDGVYVANIDGASRGNPGPASYAVVLRDPSGKVVLELAKNLGRETNNVAEYYALLAALDYAASHDIAALRIRSDSELLVRQMQGRYKVKSPDLKPLHERAKKHVRGLEYFVIEHVPREQNRDADGLANVALDRGAVQKAETRDSKTEVHPVEASRKGAAAKAAAPPGTGTHSGGRSLRDTVRRIQARFTKGVLVPEKPLNLPEGSDVSIDVHISKKD